MLLGSILLLAAPPSARAEGCRVQSLGVSIEEVTVHPKGATSFHVSLGKVPVTAELTSRRSATVVIEVNGPVAFRGSVQKLWFTVTSRVVTADGLVKIQPGAHLLATHVEGDDAVGTLVVTAGDVLEGEKKTPQETLTSVRIPCRSLALEWIEGDTESDETTDDGQARWWKPKAGRTRISLHAKAAMNAPARELSSSGCSGCLELRQLEERDGWMRVERAGEQVTATGWVRRSELERLPDCEGGGHGAVCTGDHGHGASGSIEFGCSGAPKRPPGFYAGPATVRAGTRVFAEPGRGEWATVPSEGTFEVQFVRGDAWVQIWRIKGVWGEWSAYVPAEAVTLPTK